MRVEPRLAAVPTEPEKLLAAETKGGAKMSDPAVLLPALNRVLTQFPDYSDGYAIRAGLLCSEGDRAAILADINSALEHRDNSRVEKSAGLFSMRAKIEHLNGNDDDALAELEKSINANPTEANNFVNSGAIAPEKTAGTCTWTEPDMDALVQRFPTDYRPYMLRGLYFGFFTNFNDDLSLQRRALDEFKKAAEANPEAGLPHYFAANAMLKWSLFKQANMSDQQRRDFYRAPLDELDKALTLNPKFLPALIDRANIYFRLNQFQNALSDYNRYLEIDPNAPGALDGRGPAELGLGKVSKAIDDFGKTIRAQKGLDGAEYETRADAYMKNGQWDLAIKDLTAAISHQIGNQVLLINIGQFRALYPEYKPANDEAVARKLNQTFLPNVKYEDFSQRFLQTNNGWSLQPDLYLTRSRAYLGAGDWYDAVIDFRRARNAAPYLSKFIDDERWGEITSSQIGRVYMDMKTFEVNRSESTKVWIKVVQGSGGDLEPYSLGQYELDCSKHQIRVNAIADYEASGEPKASRQGGRWESVIPETLGEIMYNGACRSH
jgi:tetratricopeptide (TPR) repeat protein